MTTVTHRSAHRMVHQEVVRSGSRSTSPYPARPAADPFDVLGAGRLALLVSLVLAYHFWVYYF
jgi:hypothetical protein